MEPRVPRFSIILPCLSTEDVLKTTLQGIAAQDFYMDEVETIVVDDASEHSLRPIVDELSARVRFEVIYLRNDSNLGRAATRNRGIAAARGQILVFMDVDQLLALDFLTTLDRAFGHCLDQSIRANTSVWPRLTRKSAFLRYYDSRFLGNRSPHELARIDLNDLPPKYYATTCIATGRSAVRAVGGFDEAFSGYGCEDEDLGIRLHAAGIPLRLALEAKSYSTDATLTVSRACRRLVEYAGSSLPRLLGKHPEYRTQMALGFLEPGGTNHSFGKRLARAAMLLLYRPAMAERLLHYLEFHDSPDSFPPKDALYKAALLGFYLRGLRGRSEVAA